jgi:hypothetical protein
MSRGSNPVLVRAQGNIAAAKAAILASICAAPCSTTESVATDHTHVEATGFVLDVQGDGTQVSYCIRNAESRSSTTSAPYAGRMSQTALESAGRSFIGSKLGGVISLAPNEQLVALSSAYRFEGGQDLQTKVMAPQMVVANRVLFGRTIDGVPIVGGGSTVVVTFANDGSVESFRYDWPKYSPTLVARAAAAPGEIVARVQRVLQARAPQSKVAPAPVSISSYPVTLSSTSQLQALECGYFDPGVALRDANAPVQSGCTYHVVETAADALVRAGYTGAVPSSTQIEPDASWQEAALLTTGTAATTPTPSPAPGTN